MNGSKQGLGLVCTLSCDYTREMLTSYLRHADSLSRNYPGMLNGRTNLIYLVCQLWGLSFYGFTANRNIKEFSSL